MSSLYICILDFVGCTCSYEQIVVSQLYVNNASYKYHKALFKFIEAQMYVFLPSLKTKNTATGDATQNQQPSVAIFQVGLISFRCFGLHLIPLGSLAR